MKSNRVLIGSAIDIMAESLGEYVSAHLSGRIGAGEWTKLLVAYDVQNGKSGHPVEATDLLAQIRLMTTSFGGRGYLFNLSRVQQRLLSELRDIRNAWAHGNIFDASDMQRALDTCLRLLKSLAHDDGVRKILDVISEAVESDSPVPSETSNEISLSDPDLHTKNNSSAIDAHHSVEDPKAAAKDISIAVSHAPTINYAMAQASFPILERVKVEYRGSEPISILVETMLTSDGSPISSISERRVDLVPGLTILSDLELVLDPGAFMQIDSRRRGKLLVRVLNDGLEVCSSTSFVDLLPSTYWSGTDTQASAELLAAFVQPQHPEIVQILSETSDLLLERTGKSELDGHQGGTERVDEIVEAVFEVLCNRGIRYSNPPASWDVAKLGGQHVRSAEEVLSERFGTCLDTTVLFAAILEQIDINTTLWLVRGHAFLAYWRVDGSALPSASLGSDSASSVFNLVNSNLLHVVETTALTNEKRMHIDAAANSTKLRHIQGPSAVENLSYVIDVAQARQSGIYPVPARAVTDSDEVTLVEYHSTTSTALAKFLKQKAERPVAATDHSASVVPSRVAQWKNSLLDLSARNRLLNFTASARFPLSVPERVVAGCEDLVNDGISLELLPEDEIGGVDLDRYKTGPLLPVERRVDLLLEKGKVFTHTPSASYKTKLRRMAAEAKIITDQSGANNLYLVLGTLLWSMDGKELRSPLILLPVLLQPAGRGGHFRIMRDESGTSTPNYCLAEKLREQFNLSIPEFESPVSDSSGIDLEKTFSTITQAMMAADLPFHVEKSVDLSILQFAKFRMWKDLDENWQSFIQAPLVRHLVESPTSEFADPATIEDADANIDLDDLASRIPLPADASQLEAVASAAVGRTFVLEGPPGTGKSQTITNLLAHAMSTGKKILFVAEKRAALEVVRKRLNDVGLGVYTLDLHDKGSRPNAVREQIRDSLDHHVHADNQGMQLVSSDLRSARRKLASYASRIHEESVSGFSAYSANNSTLVVDSEVVPFPISEQFASQTEKVVISRIEEILSDLPETAELACPTKNHPWGFIDSHMGNDVQARILQEQTRLDAALEDTKVYFNGDSGANLISVATDPAFLRDAAQLLEGQISAYVLDQVNDERWQRSLNSIQHGAAELVKELGWISKVVVIPNGLLVDLSGVVAEAQEIEASGFLGLGRNKRRQQLIAETFGASWHGDDQDAKNLVAVLQGLLEAQAKRAALIEELNALPGFKIGENWNPFDPDELNFVAVRRLELTNLATKFKRMLSESSSHAEVQAIQAFLQSPEEHDSNTAELISEVADSWDELIRLLPGESNGMRAWSQSLGFLYQFRATQNARNSTSSASRDLSRWVAFLESLEILRKHGLHEARDLLVTGAYLAEDALRGFMRGTAEAALRERLDTGALSDFNEKLHLKQISQFNQLSGDIKQHLVKALPARISDRRVPILTQAGPRLGELQRQLNRKRGGQTVRQLMSNYGDLITEIMPCVLVSPDSAARFFPARAGLFDVVVFDEASQICVAEAIGTLGRANSAIIVGDSKQMPPTSFGGSSFDAENDDDVMAIADEESILSECVQARVPRQWLSWHYRSQDESLIAFSNQHYYEGKLSSFPAPRNNALSINSASYGVSFVRVNGKFHRSGESSILRTNPVEAQAIVDEVRKRFAASPEQRPSIGIVTFNVQQRNYIEGLIRDLGDANMTEALDLDDDGLFVKNLENVQGDERDVILFSTAFSVNDSGKLPLNFGPLNNTGGERRLNVAITRARKQVLVFCSFDPEDLRSENSNSIGIKHLRAYLDLAAQGTRILKRSVMDGFAPDRYRDQIALMLEERGYVVEKNLGLSDFKIDLAISTSDRPDEPLTAVLLDNEAWAERRTVGDRDGLPEQVLRNVLGWQSIARIWLPAWLQDSKSVLDRLAQVTEEASSKRAELEESSLTLQNLSPILTGASSQENELSEATNADEGLLDRKTNAIPEENNFLLGGTGIQLTDDSVVQTNESLDNVEPAGYKTNVQVPYEDNMRKSDDSKPRRHVAWVHREIGSTAELDDLHHREARVKATDLLSEISAVEWPVTSRRLSKIANGAFGMGKVSATREKTMLKYLDKATYTIDREGFVWPVTIDKQNWTGYRVEFSANGLALTDISPREISNAMCSLVRQHGTCSIDDLKRQAMLIFGYKRLTTGLSQWLHKGIDLATVEGRLTMAGQDIELA